MEAKNWEVFKISDMIFGQYFLAFSLTENVLMKQVKKHHICHASYHSTTFFHRSDICISSSNTAANIVHNSSMGFASSAPF